MNKDIPYVETLPSHWSVIQNRFLFRYDGHKVGDSHGDYQLLSLTTGGVKERDINASGGKVPASYDNYQTVKKGQMVFCLFDLDCSAVFSGISNYDGMITSAYDVFSSTEMMDNGYADYWFKYVFSNRYYKMFSKSIRYTITGDMFRSLKTPVPPMEVQKRISAFLLEQETKVDTLIANVQAQIEKLKAYKQSVITEVVTKGLDPTVPMKDSGVAWIGEIPEHWTIARIKNVTTILRGASPRPIDDYLVTPGTGENWIKIGDTIKDHKYITQTAQQVSHEGADKSRRVHKGDLILTNSMSFGEPYILAIDGCIHDGWLALTSLRGITEDYMYYFLQSSFCFLQFKRQVAGGIVQNLNSEKVAACIIYCPPEAEQRAVVEYLDKKCSQIERLISIKQSKIEKLEQYKRTLIYEYVTGKKVS